MNLYLIEQEREWGYEYFKSAVVAAPSKKVARLIRPSGEIYPNWPEWDSWVKNPSQVKVTYLGQAKPGTEIGVIHDSFRAG